MNARETYNAIQTGNRADQQQALFELLAVVQALSTAVLELAGKVRLDTGHDPLMLRSRTILAEFIELPPQP